MSLQLFDLTGEIALITGGTHGLGMAIARGLAGAGARLVINDIHGDKLDNALQLYHEAGIVASGYLFDVTDEKEVGEMIPRIEKEAGPISILVNNAGIIRRTPLVEMTVEDFRLVLDVDLVALFYRSQSYCQGHD